jgi:tetratricopeptide (TPR) repeat protein/2-polyprenyl-3-methyl-5-hydroxy-6-metoxy-1,4-benzoquinol methylase
MKSKSGALFTNRVSLNAHSVDANFQQAMRLHQQGYLAQARLLYESVLRAKPNHCQALHLQGVIELQVGNFLNAVDLIDKAIQIDPRHQAFHCDRGNALLRLNQYDLAVNSYDEAIRLKADYFDAFVNRGAALTELRQFEAAVASYTEAIAINPTFPDVQYNCGTALLMLRRFEEALSSYNAAIESRRDFPAAIRGRGIALSEIANDLMGQGKYCEALSGFISALRQFESIQAKRGFAKCVRHVAFSEVSQELRSLVTRAITEAWIRPANLFSIAASIVRQDQTIRVCIDRAEREWPKQLSQDELFGNSGLKSIAGDPLIRSLLEDMQVASRDLERFFTMLRRILLDMASETNDVNQTSVDEGNDSSKDLLALLCSIARQCYINEYVFTASDEELGKIHVLRQRVDLAIQSSSTFPELWLAAIAAYGPLGELEITTALLDLKWHEPIKGLIIQQLLEPQAERNYRSTIPTLTRVQDIVSRLVQEQYEANPYPRWIKVVPVEGISTVDSYLQNLFPKAILQPTPSVGKIEVLIAGCGTGQQSIESAQIYRNGNVLAIDLSLSSLCYAKRKSDEVGLKNIEYAQADIMELGSFDRTFDIVESVGVLHHLADPVGGWRLLAGLLKPGGFMRLGFYSNAARQNVVAARQHIASQGYSANPADIRRCRQDLLSNAMQNEFDEVLSFRDFYGMSECRDLLFHVQEHLFTIPQINGILQDLSLNFIGFSFDSDISSQYHTMYPDDFSETNLENWDRFEAQNPDTFAGMYQFWVQKPL